MTLMDEVVFWDSAGRVVAHKDEGDDVVFLWSGEPVAIVDDESVFAFDGRHLGWFLDGWIRDHAGNCVYFTDEAAGGARRPRRHARPARGPRQSRPSRRTRQPRPARSARTTQWSALSVDAAFFQQ
jgi:hypothetical protein